MSDIRLQIEDETEFADIILDARDVETDGGLETAVLISLFSDAREDDETLLPDDRGPKGGWYGWKILPEDIECGSKLWLLSREKDSARALTLAEQYAKESLQWMIDQEIASEILATAEASEDGHILLYVKIVKPGVEDQGYRFLVNWKNQLARSE